MSISTAPTVAPTRIASASSITPTTKPVTVLTPDRLPTPSRRLPGVVWQLAALGGLVIWAYLPMLRVFFDKWVNDPQYSHGFLVPIFSGYLLWKDRQNGPLSLRPLPWVGAALLAMTLGMRAVAGSILFHQLDAASLLVALAAVAIVAGGMPLLRRTGPAILFLVFMIPLPYELERNVGQPLKTAATVSSTYLLQTLGQPAIRDGNVILIDELRLGVVDACSGLKMLVTFAAFSVGAVLLMQRSHFEKLMVLLGIIPVAIASNVLRITGTGLGYTAFSGPEMREFIHNALGWLMMPIGLAMLGLEVWALRRLVVDPLPQR